MADRGGWGGTADAIATPQRSDAAAGALGVVARALRALAERDTAGAAAADLCDLVDAAGDELVVLAGDPLDDGDAAVMLLGWRDQLGSHVHASRALGDLDVHADLQVDLLYRGLRDVAASARAVLDECGTGLRLVPGLPRALATTGRR